MENRNSKINQPHTLLADGAVCMGENHIDSNGRETLFLLIDKGNIEKLFLEIPACSKEVQEYLADTSTKLNVSAPQAVQAYIDTMKNNTQGRDNKKISWVEIITYAKEKGVAVYCHDLPIVEYCWKSKKNKLSYICDIGDVIDDAHIRDIYSVNPYNEFNKMLGNCKSNQPRRLLEYLKNSYSKESGILIRNQYSAEIIKLYTNNLSPENMRGVVIYGGIDHFDTAYIDNSLQELCNIKAERVLNYAPVAKLNTVNKLQSNREEKTINTPISLSSQSIFPLDGSNKENKTKELNEVSKSKNPYHP